MEQRILSSHRRTGGDFEDPVKVPVSVLLREVTKRYGSVTAVESISFQVRRGEVAGLLGTNGAGKTTLLKMMSTWLAPTTGRIEIEGRDVQREPLSVRRMLGYLPEHTALYEVMRVDRFLTFVGKLRGLHTSELAARTAWVVEKCGLCEILDKRIHECSKGNRQRIGLAAALIHNPRVLLLDEPTHGLDPLQVAAFLDLVLELRRGRTVIFSSHILSELLAVSDRLLIINRGRLAADTTIPELKEAARDAGRELDQAILELIRSEGKTR